MAFSLHAPPDRDRHAAIRPRCDAITQLLAVERIALALLNAPCLFRRIALAELDRAGLAWRVTFASSGLHGLWAAVAAGLGLTLRTAIGLPAGLRALGPADGLPRVREPAIPICLHDGGRRLSPALDRLRDIIRETLTTNLPDPVFGSVESG